MGYHASTCTDLLDKHRPKTGEENDRHTLCFGTMMAIPPAISIARGIGPKHWEQEQWRDDCRETFRVDEMGNSNPNEGGSVNRRHNVS